MKTDVGARDPCGRGRLLLKTQGPVYAPGPPSQVARRVDEGRQDRRDGLHVSSHLRVPEHGLVLLRVRAGRTPVPRKDRERFGKDAWDKFWQLPGNIKPYVIPSEPGWADARQINVQGEHCRSGHLSRSACREVSPPGAAGMNWKFENLESEPPWTCWWLWPDLCRP